MRCLCLAEIRGRGPCLGLTRRGLGGSTSLVVGNPALQLRDLARAVVPLHRRRRLHRGMLCLCLAEIRGRDPCRRQCLAQLRELCLLRRESLCRLLFQRLLCNFLRDQRPAQLRQVGLQARDAPRRILRGRGRRRRGRLGLCNCRGCCWRRGELPLQARRALLLLPQMRARLGQLLLQLGHLGLRRRARLPGLARLRPAAQHPLLLQPLLQRGNLLIFGAQHLLQLLL